MLGFEILCVTMNQTDFSKIWEMNINSDIVFANQCDHTSYEELEFNGNKAKMISTNTRGVGVNRNLSLSYASADICLLADDDVIYIDNIKEVVLSEFEANPDADIIIFNLDSNDSVRKQIKYNRTRKCGMFERMPWGGCRIAFRLNSIRKANLWFTTLFGGGCIFPSGEDSMWLTEAKRRGLTFYVSKQTVGTVNFNASSWFQGYNEAFFYGKGAFYQAIHPRTKNAWMLYFLWRTRKSGMTLHQKIKAMRSGMYGYRHLIPYESKTLTISGNCKRKAR